MKTKICHILRSDYFYRPSCVVRSCGQFQRLQTKDKTYLKVARALTQSSEAKLSLTPQNTAKADGSVWIGFLHTLSHCMGRKIRAQNQTSCSVKCKPLVGSTNPRLSSLVYSYRRSYPLCSTEPRNSRPHFSP